MTHQARHYAKGVDKNRLKAIQHDNMANQQAGKQHQIVTM